VFIPAGDLLKKIQAHTLQFTCLHTKYIVVSVISVRKLLRLLLYNSLNEVNQKRSDVQAMKFIYVGLEHFESDVFVPAYDSLKKIQAHTLQFTCLHTKCIVVSVISVRKLLRLLLYISLVECQKRSDVQAMKFIHGGLENFKPDVYVPTCDLLKKYKHIRYNLLVYPPNTLLFQSFLSVISVRKLLGLFFTYQSRNAKRSDVQAMKFIHGGLENFKSDVYVPAGDLLKKYKHIRQNLLVYQPNTFCFGN
jgi:hypothetical protein